MIGPVIGDGVIFQDHPAGVVIGKAALVGLVEAQRVIGTSLDITVIQQPERAAVVKNSAAPVGGPVALHDRVLVERGVGVDLAGDGHNAGGIVNGAAVGGAVVMYPTVEHLEIGPGVKETAA